MTRKEDIHLKLNARKDVPIRETWDLSLIYATEADFEAAVEKAKTLADTLEKTYKNALATPESIAEEVKCVLAHREDYAKKAEEALLHNGLWTHRVEQVVRELSERKKKK